METVLRDIKMTACYLDDIIITGRTDEEHPENLDCVLNRLNSYGLKVKISKCSFFKDDVEYCGYTFSEKGVSMSKKKIEAILKIPKPKNVSEVKSLCGLINYYRSHIENLSSILFPLYIMLEAVLDASFHEAKSKMIRNMTLANSDSNVPIV
ncbi:Transposon Ty3-I Gag-Pol polyprotein [Thelohanellus kitauei]|uniref:Transposon Ty3-I Gag-Pol polyprotein n=1 Tax=Thelohanellus kitauei TaxID=669202 RepID=A0A0C2ILS8_THEKT|nr:Transposon Ty3-I Gag-Pol polyprotein [Thelohanellus kitauei]